MKYDIKVRCKHCDRFLKVKVKASSSFVITCSDRRCKKENEIEVIMLSDIMRGKHE